MARQRKRRNRRPRPRQPRPANLHAHDAPPSASSLRQLIEDTAATFSCSTATINDFANQCDDEIEQAEAPLVFNTIAADIWRPCQGAAEPLAGLLADYADVRTRYVQDLTEIRRRLADLAARDVLQHIHLEPLDQYRKLVRDRAFPELPHYQDPLP